MPTSVYVSARGYGKIQVDAATTITVGVAYTGPPPPGPQGLGLPGPSGTPQPGEGSPRNGGIPYFVTRTGQGVIQTGFLSGDGMISVGP